MMKLQRLSKRDSRTRRSYVLLGSTISSALLCLSLQTQAFAEEDGGNAAADLTLPEVAGSIAVALDDVGAADAVAQHSLVDSSTEASQALTAELPAGELQVGLPASDYAGSLGDGTAVFSGEGDTAVSTQLLADGVRVLVSIPEEAAPQRFEFEFAGDAATLERGDDGTISVLDAGGHLLGDIAAPWAVDANGVSVPTEYVIDGSKIVQLVHHQGGGYTYPVTADPSIFFYIKCAGQIALFIAENGGPGKILKGGVAGAKTLVKILKSKGSKKDALKYLAYELSGAKGLADLVDKCFPS